MACRQFIFTAALALVSLPALGAPAPELAAPSTSVTLVSVEAFLERLRQPIAQPSASAGYVPRTAHDNSPYRFDMTQNGRRMTAAEFDAWMKSRGIRVATGRPSGSAAAAAAAPIAAGAVPVVPAPPAD